MKGQLYDLYNGVDDDWSLDYDAKKRAGRVAELIALLLPEIGTPTVSPLQKPRCS